jgi:hypothetical protein
MGNMQEREICVRVVDDRWGVVFESRDNDIEESVSVKMPSKEDAVRYARICEQRTGNKVSLPE